MMLVDNLQRLILNYQLDSKFGSTTSNIHVTAALIDTFE